MIFPSTFSWNWKPNPMYWNWSNDDDCDETSTKQTNKHTKKTKFSSLANAYIFCTIEKQIDKCEYVSVCVQWPMANRPTVEEVNKIHFDQNDRFSCYTISCVWVSSRVNHKQIDNQRSYWRSTWAHRKIVIFVVYIK